MIYKIYIIDDSGVAIFSSSFKPFGKKSIENQILAYFFKAVNKMIDTIHEAMLKEDNLDNKMRTIEAENSNLILYYHQLSNLLICVISDAEDNIETLKYIAKDISESFWNNYRNTIIDLENNPEKVSLFKPFEKSIIKLTKAGRIAEDFPKLIIIKNVLKKLRTMGILTDFEYLVALKCNGEYSPLEIARLFDKNKMEIYDVLKKLEELEIIIRQP